MIGMKLAHYEITSHLGSGGMGDVYQATDLKLGRSVAIKFLPEAFSHDNDRVARFEREARVLASLNHSNIAAIHGLEESGERKFLVMELVGGTTLAERIARGPIPMDEAPAIAKQIAKRRPPGLISVPVARRWPVGIATRIGPPIGKIDAGFVQHRLDSIV